MAEKSEEPVPASPGSGAPLDSDEKLLADVERAIQNGTYGAVRRLVVGMDEGTVVLRGSCSAYYTKQLAQDAALKVGGVGGLRNEIEVDK